MHFVPLNELLMTLALGAGLGFFGGLFGIGGGMLMVPFMTIILSHRGVEASMAVKMAIATSMATILFTSLSSLRAHHAHQAVLWPVVRQLTPGILLGTMLGTQLAAHISSRSLSIFFVGFMLLLALQMIANLRPMPSRRLPGWGGLSLAGSFIGAIASLAALGGGALTVPYLIWCNVPPHRAIGTSAAVGLPIAVGGTIGYIWNGWAHADLPAGSFGFVYLPALCIILLASVLAAPLGARLAHRLPIKVLKRVFAGLLLVLSAKMLWSLYGT